MSQMLTFSFPEIFSQSRKSRSLQAEGEDSALKEKGALAAVRAASILSFIPTPGL